MMPVAAILILAFCIFLAIRAPAIAVITSPPAAVAVLIAAIFYESPLGIALSVCIFLVPVLTVLIAQPRAGLPEWPRTVAKWNLIFVPCLAVLGVSVLAFGPPFAYGAVFFIALVAVLIGYLLVSRHAVAAFVFSTIGASMRQNLPLPAALESAAAGRADECSRILCRISAFLQEGRPLSEAVRVGYPACPGHAVAMIAAAEKIGQLPRAIAGIEADLAQKTVENRKVKPVHPIYPVIVIFIAFWIVTLLAIFILPKLDQVFAREFDIELPAPTRIVFQVTPVFAGSGAAFISIIMFVVPAAVYARFRPRRPDRPLLLSRVGDWVKWHLPVFRRFELNSSLVQIVEVLRLSLEAGCPVNEAIASALSMDVNGCYRRRLGRWAESVERGENVSIAARRCGVGSAVAWAFDHKLNPGNAPEILQALESFYRSNYSYLVNMARYIFWPCVVILLAAMVGFIAYAIFSPLVVMLQAMTETIP